MNVINPLRSGIVLGALTGAFHFLWASLVALGLAQELINFIFWIHFIKPIYVIEPFSIGLALALVTFTTAIGFVIGYSLAHLWNLIH